MTLTDITNASSAALAAPAVRDVSVPDESVATTAARFAERVSFLALGARWVTVGLGSIVVYRSGHNQTDIASTTILVAIALASTLRHAQAKVNIDRNFVLYEMVGCGIAVVASGGLGSPYVLAPAIPLMLAGYVLSERQAVLLAYLAVAATVTLWLFQSDTLEAPRSVSLVGVVYLLCGVLGVITRRAVADMDTRHDEAMHEVSRLTQANDLLVALHGLAQSMPSSLDMAAVITDLRRRIDAALPNNVVSLHLRNSATQHWHHEIAYGVRETQVLTDDELPYPLRVAALQPIPLIIAEYLHTQTQGVSAFARSGIYTALRARGQVIGLLAIEHDAASSYTDHSAAALQHMLTDFALGLDNAMWFARLRTLGAEAERARIARDLHDRIAQSLAYVSFELERLCLSETAPTRSHLGELREVLHEVVTELRDTLYDLRATITEDEGLVAIALKYLDHMQKRHNFVVHTDARIETRLPTTVEQELWRIVQEGLHNVAKHSGASAVRFAYGIDGATATIMLSDNGCGFVPRQVRSGHYGLIGMRERAESVGAMLDIASSPGKGTTIRISVEVPT